jgi:hypothetical protein
MLHLHSVQHWDVNVHLPDHLNETSEIFILHMLFYFSGKWHNVCIIDVLGRSFLKVYPFLFWPWFCLNLSLGFIFLSVGLIGAVLLDFVLGSALVLRDRVITTFTFFFGGTTGCLGKSP